MSNVLSVLWSMDSKFVLSGSNEMNVRVWKARAAEKIGPVRLQLGTLGSRGVTVEFYSSPLVRKPPLPTVRSFANSSRSILRFVE